MQKNRFSHARRIFSGIVAALVLGLAGCQTPAITNLTPDALAENPSQIYTISARISPKDAGYVRGTLIPRIIIDGQNFTMTKSPLGENIYEFEYQVPAGRTEIKYYFLISYQVESSGILTPREDYSQIFTANIAGRYVLSLEVNRGPVGARISILGRGFTANDTVFFDNTPVRTVFESPNAISFYVPAVEPNRNYKVTLGNGSVQSPVGTFRVDALGGATEGGSPSVATATGAVAGPLSVTPSSLNLRTGEKAQVTFTTPVTASAGGLLIDVTTDVPESVIMPEVVVPAGSNTVTVTVEGGRPGNGNLFAKGAGVRELTIPISVR
ncbi:cell surface protein [Opitutaceae bacterium EW11]|nr:cell surface protein [Opitutaceae bacterium EW11]